MNKINKINFLAVITLLAVALSSCEAIAGIFKAGIWVGIIIVVLVVAVIFWLINKARK